MVYSDYTIEAALETLHLGFESRFPLFRNLTPVEPSPHLREFLAGTLDLAGMLDTPKGWSELVIAPILLDIWRRFDRHVAFHSGVSLDVDAERGLGGVCDFFLSRSPSQFLPGPPAVVITVSKNDNIKDHLGECIAQLVASGLSSERAGLKDPAIYGAVTTGREWQFLRLKDQVIYLDPNGYYPRDVRLILGILMRSFEEMSSEIPKLNVGSMADLPIGSREAMIDHIRWLLHTHDVTGVAWENATSHSFLEAMAAWLNDSDGYYRHTGQSVDPRKPSWRLFADALSAATVYE